MWNLIASPQKPSELLAGFSNSWETNLEAPALQPKREITPPKSLVVAAESTAKILLTARIFADSLPEPLTEELSISMTVKKIEFKASEIMEEIFKIEEK